MKMKAIAVSLVVVLALAMLALPGKASAADCRVRIGLQQTPFGQTLAATGKAEKRSQKNGGRQTFTLEVDTIVPDGTIFVVFVNNATLAGTITVARPLGQPVAIGTLDLSNALGPLPLGVDPVCAISSVLVTDAAGNVVLTGSF